MDLDFFSVDGVVGEICNRRHRIYFPGRVLYSGTEIGIVTKDVVLVLVFHSKSDLVTRRRRGRRRFIGSNGHSSFSARALFAKQRRNLAEARFLWHTCL